MATAMAWSQLATILVAALLCCRSISAEMPKIAIIGAAGYVGAKLQDELMSEGSWEVHGFDRDPRGLSSRVTTKSALDISTDELASFRAVVYLGGYTGRVMCDKSPQQCMKENVDETVAFASRLNANQLLVFASTSAVTEGSGANPQTEAGAVDITKLDSYSNSMAAREKALSDLSSSGKGPQMVGVRFGTVVGTSPSQRIDLIHMALVCSAYGTGRLRVSYPDSNRAILAIDDLVRAISYVLRQPELSGQFEIYHLKSFNTKVAAVANEVASQTSANIDIVTSGPPSTPGFSLDSSKFELRYNFHFKTTQGMVVSDLVQNVPTVCLGRDITHRLSNDSVPCTVCGSTDVVTVLDLGAQPLANDFSEDVNVALKRERFPLKLVHCRKCHHAQLSYLVDRERLFANYHYQSGTSSTLAKHFEFIADKVIKDTGKKTGTVLEIASNDGTQLDKFKDRSWKTYGVDPAKNLVKLAAAKGHNAINAFWGQGTIEGLPKPSELDAIVAQNVFAHVFTPVEFLHACVNVMGPSTLLYIQTSQCEMFHSGQFDTVYHEHVSFFSAHSFKYAAEQAGLTIVNFEIVPIHGRSCLVTFQKAKGDHAQALQPFLQLEEKTGMTSDWFYKQYRSRAGALRDWIHSTLQQFAAQKYTIIGYGAAAKGMVLLHYIKTSPSQTYEFDFVVDDAPLKQNTYCPGTSVPVKPTSALKDVDPSRPLVIVIFAWNFLEEIVDRIRSTLQGTAVQQVLAIIPFPTQKVVRIGIDGASPAMADLLTNPALPLPWPGVTLSTKRCPVVAIQHFYNEELLLPFWVRHHAAAFDKVLLLDYQSNDTSRALLAAEMPSSWKVFTSNNHNFHATAVDDEVVAFERELPLCAWKVALTTTEFVVHPNLRRYLAEMETRQDVSALRFHAHIMVGDDSKVFNPYTQLLVQRSQVAVGDHLAGHYGRFLHRSSPELRYTPGRHSINKPFAAMSEGYIAKYYWTPWPQILPRKLHIKSRIPATDLQQGFGVQHDTNQGILEMRRAQALTSPLADLSHFKLNTADSLTNDKLAWYANMYGNVTFIW